MNILIHARVFTYYLGKMSRLVKDPGRPPYVHVLSLVMQLDENIINQIYLVMAQLIVVHMATLSRLPDPEASKIKEKTVLGLMF